MNYINPHQLYSSISTGLHKLSSNPPITKQKSILVDPNQGSAPNSPIHETLQEKVLGQRKGKNPFKKRVTLGYIPSRLTRVNSETADNEDTLSVGCVSSWTVGQVQSTIVPPSVRIQGCTPPSEHDSLDGEICKYFKGVSSCQSYQSV